MNRFTSKRTGEAAVMLGVTGLLAFASLLLFFLGLFQNIASLSFMGAVNDIINVVAALLSALLAAGLHPELRRSLPGWSWLLLIAVWVGAIAIAFGSWLIQSGRSDVELSSYHYFFGNSLIGGWLNVLNRITRRQAVWPRSLTRLGSLAGALMMVGVISLYGILLGLDGNDYSPLVMIAGISYLGTGIFYPIWALKLGRWILSDQRDRTRAGQRTVNS